MPVFDHEHHILDSRSILVLPSLLRRFHEDDPQSIAMRRSITALMTELTIHTEIADGQRLGSERGAAPLLYNRLNGPMLVSLVDSTEKFPEKSSIADS